MSLSIFPSRVLIVGITPYFLEKQAVWFKENLSHILEARKTQSFFEDNILFIESHQSIPFSQFIRKLDEMGYEKVQTIERQGEFSQRGGIVDIFPINLNSAVRLEFVGNKIEEIYALETAIEDEKKAKELLKKKLKSQKLFSDLKGLKPQEYLVHLDHGVGKFLGFSSVKDISSGATAFGHKETYYVIEYAKGDKLYVPVSLERKLSRYIGFTEPHISRLGSESWQRTKSKVKEETDKMAKELLELYAARELEIRAPYFPPDEIDEALRASFPYEETPDQKEAIKDIQEDLAKSVPMDRLICGDVGFGKTEVALRAMVQIAKSGNQAVLICPTTILAFQHFQNFTERLKNMALEVALLTRLQTKSQQHRIIQQLKEGKIDILIGTHRILSLDTTPLLFAKNGKGLLVIDDEQRFGVKQKELLKKMKGAIDVLSLSATPIPRTLHLSLSSLTDISIIQTPPEGRLSVRTIITPFAKKIIKEGIERELYRNGQVYYLHNRIETMEAVKKSLATLLPRAQIRTAHGRMNEKELISIMREFREGRFNVLVATTIIENGLDIPQVNSLFVDDVTKLGLAETYQIRGRIGRSHAQAFAYFLHSGRLTEKAQLRLQALKEAEQLGSGYKIALRDLEIRGAGNILGKQQSGNINQVGFNLYCQMLSDAVEKLRQ